MLKSPPKGGLLRQADAAVGFPTAAFAFVSDFHPCYKISFEK